MLSQWNWKWLLGGLGTIFFLLLTWLLPSTKIYWNFLDTHTFYFLNHWIQTSKIQQNFWAFWNHSIADWVHDLVMLSFFFYFIFRSKEGRITRSLQIIYGILLLLFVILFVNGHIIREYLHFKRYSPTKIFPDAFHLSQHISWIAVKDYAKYSFPGDHATTACLFMLLIFYLMGKKSGCLALAYTIFWCLPRLIVGAHWLSDDLVGSFSIALVSFLLFFATPLQQLYLQFFQKIIKMLKVWQYE